MDDQWIYGGHPGNVFESIARARPNGMPAYGGMLSENHIWMLVAYVPSLGEQARGGGGEAAEQTEQQGQQPRKRMFAMPPLMVTSVMLALDRTVRTHFFNSALGGEPLLWQHVFWFFGHPEVYIIFLPALGMVSSIVVTFSRRRIFGYTPMVLALVATGFVAFGLWVHHMFATGLSPLGISFFTAASMMVAIPSGIQIFCWIITLWHGKLVLKTPLWFIMGFVLIVVLGDLTGVMLAPVPFDLEIHDTFFVVAHFHYVLIGGAVFPLFGALYYWFPKFTDRLLDERLGHLNFWRRRAPR
jgi:cytochrome c oxidase subunit I+III